VTPSAQAPLTFTADPEVVRLVLQGHRLAYGHQTNPTFATETAKIEPLPHQHTAVYEWMLSQSRLRFLLAYDAGAVCAGARFSTSSCRPSSSSPRRAAKSVRCWRV